MTDKLDRRRKKKDKLGRRHDRVTKWDIRRMIKLREEGCTWERIGEILNRNPKTVRHHVQKSNNSEAIKLQVAKTRQNEHSQKLFNLMMEFRDQLVVKANEPLDGYDVVFPVSFDKPDVEKRRYSANSLSWRISTTGDVSLWFNVEHETLFSSLKEHLSKSDIWGKFDQLRQILSDTISQTRETGRNTYAKNAVQLAIDIAEAIDIELERVTITGSCSLCR